MLHAVGLRRGLSTLAQRLPVGRQTRHLHRTARLHPRLPASPRRRFFFSFSSPTFSRTSSPWSKLLVGAVAAVFGASVWVVSGPSTVVHAEDDDGDVMTPEEEAAFVYRDALQTQKLLRDDIKANAQIEKWLDQAEKEIDAEARRLQAEAGEPVTGMVGKDDFKKSPLGSVVSSVKDGVKGVVSGMRGEGKDSRQVVVDDDEYFLLPKTIKNEEGEDPLTVVIELDNTLARVSHANDMGWIVQLRPYARRFLTYLNQCGYEVIIWTHLASYLAQPMLLELDDQRDVKHFLYRDSCSRSGFLGNKLHFDLKRLNRDTNRVIVLSNDPNAYKLYPNNGIHVPALEITPWADRKHLVRLAAFLRFFPFFRIQDVRPHIERFHKNKEAPFAYYFGNKKAEQLESVKELFHDDVLSRVKGWDRADPNRIVYKTQDEEYNIHIARDELGARTNPLNPGRWQLQPDLAERYVSEETWRLFDGHYHDDLVDLAQRKHHDYYARNQLFYFGQPVEDTRGYHEAEYYTPSEDMQATVLNLPYHYTWPKFYYEHLFQRTRPTLAELYKVGKNKMPNPYKGERLVDYPDAYREYMKDIERKYDLDLRDHEVEREWRRPAFNNYLPLLSQEDVPEKFGPKWPHKGPDEVLEETPLVDPAFTPSYSDREQSLNEDAYETPVEIVPSLNDDAYDT